VATGGVAAAAGGVAVCCVLLHAASETSAAKADTAIAGVRRNALIWVLYAISDLADMADAPGGRSLR
jgi:hypothetical protein